MLNSLVEEAVHVPVDAQMAHLAIVIGIEDVLVEAVVAADTALRALAVDTVDVVVGIEESVGIITRMPVVLVEGAEAVIFVQHIVHLKLRRPTLPNTLPLLIAATEVEVGTNVIGKVVLLQ